MRMIAHVGFHPHFCFSSSGFFRVGTAGGKRSGKAAARNSMLREANLKDRLMYAVGKRIIFRVQGDSMLPTVKDGDAVMIIPTKSIEIGDVVLSDHPYRSSVKILKRVSEINADGRYSLTGDNPTESTDSRTFGTVPIEYIYGKAVCRIS